MSINDHQVTNFFSCCNEVNAKHNSYLMIIKLSYEITNIWTRRQSRQYYINRNINIIVLSNNKENTWIADSPDDQRLIHPLSFINVRWWVLEIHTEKDNINTFKTRAMTV